MHCLNLVFNKCTINTCVIIFISTKLCSCVLSIFLNIYFVYIIIFSRAVSFYIIAIFYCFNIYIYKCQNPFKYLFVYIINFSRSVSFYIIAIFYCFNIYIYKCLNKGPYFVLINILWIFKFKNIICFYYSPIRD